MTIRPAIPEDAAGLAELLNELDLHVGNPGGVFTAEKVLADGFGPEAAFHCLVAEGGTGLLGYLLWYPAYDTDLAARKMWVSDIYVRPAGRGKGVGAALLRAAAAEALARGWPSLELPAFAEESTLRFYRGLKGHAKGAEVFRWEGADLAALGAGEPKAS
ncbi:GNAT family N-acetyltransferase [Telmatospirillum sp. J64-1]|uniref:GNAT family N-acetyltransferase n=1 Tax=Telmatospirillum sp. J64-1 TaxID=2502183 RepID=UPI00115EC47D|nr:GNAT family N-acetyltransferase [Telmatospirillum sp. J64-1]